MPPILFGEYTMAKQWKMTVGTTGLVHPDRTTMAYVETGTEVGANEISVYIGNNVSEARQVEFVAAWRWLYNGVRERNLLDAQFKGFILYTGASIDSLTTTDRRTESTIASFTDDDVVLGIGSAVTGLGERVDIAEAFKALGNFALESTLKAA